MTLYILIFMFFTPFNFLSLRADTKNPDIVCTFKQSPNRVPEQPAPSMDITYQNATGVRCCADEDAEACQEALHNSALKYCENPPAAAGKNNKPIGNKNIPEDYKLEPIAKVICGKKTFEFKKEE